MTNPPPELKIPRYSWPTSGWWATIVGTLIGGIVFLAPDTIELPILSRVLLFLAIAILPAAMILIGTWFHRLLVFYRRATNYESAILAFSDIQTELDKNSQLTNLLLQERQSTRAFKIEHAYLYNSVAYIALNKKPGFTADPGDILTVVDQSNGKHLGDFEVTELKPKHYIARALGDIDALWMGYIVQNGASPSAPPPESLAIKFQKNDDQ